MSLPNYLAQIKSSGLYRYVFDKSQIPAQDAQTMRLVVGYSEKGPFNTPVYINGNDKETFKKIFGDVNKKLERKGIFFHRLAMQALEAGPIYCLNLKSIGEEKVTGISFNAGAIEEPKSILVKDLFDRSRFWYLDPDKLIGNKELDNYVSIAMTDESKSSATIFIRSFVPSGYNVTFRDWFSKNTNGETMPEYLEGHEDEKVQDYFAEVYVFKGKITKQIASSEALNKYFNIDGDNIYLSDNLTNAFGESIDTLQALAEDSNSNFIESYSGILLPEFKNVNNTIISLDAQFNQDNSLHKMMMTFNSDALYDGVIGKNDDPFDVTMLNTTGFGSIESVDVTDGTVKMKDGSEMFSSTSLDVTATVMAYANDAWTKEISGGEEIIAYKFDDAVDAEGEEITLPDSMNAISVNVGDKVFENGKVYTITSVNKELDETSGAVNSTKITAVDNEGSTLEQMTNYVLLNKSIGASNKKGILGTYMEGYEYAKDSSHCGTSMFEKYKWQTEILNCLKEYKGIRLALTSRVDIAYKYIIDTFEAYPSPEVHSQLAIIAKEKDNAFAFLTTPSVKNMSKCDYTSFLNDNGEFDTKYVVDGGNRQRPMSMVLSLSREPNGASYCGYFTNLIIKENGVNKTIPSTAAVSNAFMEKYNTAFPYSIVAGPNRGKISCEGLVGPEFNWSRYDLDNLEPFGINAIIYVPGKGVYINSNKTAKKDPVSALSAINVRELVTYIQDEIEKIMQTYHWESNTPALRGNIKDLADKLCEDIQANGGLYVYENVCDESNNTDEVIDNEILVLDTAIEPGRGAGKMVQKLTIYRKGGIKAAYSE